MDIVWVTTAPNPKASCIGYDAGQRGWKQHAVRATPDETFDAIKRRPALCGLSPRRGWGFDMFIEDKCSRCLAKMQLISEKRGTQ